MTSIARYAKARAKPGQGDALASLLLEVADNLREVPGCQLYVINRAVEDQDVVWVTEQWRSQEQLDAALASEGARERIPEVLALLDEGGFERIDLQPLGGAGLPAQNQGLGIVNLDELEDMAAKYGHGETGEARFARGELGASAVGLSLHRLRPGKRQDFGHRHTRDEEVYVVLRGSGRIAIDDGVYEIRTLDAIRVAAGSARAFEAGDEGLDVLATGTHHPGDAELLPGYWPA